MRPSNAEFIQKHGGISSLKIETLDSVGGHDLVWQLDSQKATGQWETGQVNITGRDVVISVEKDPNVNDGFAAVDEFFFDRNLDFCFTEPAGADVKTTTTKSPPSGPSRFAV